MLQVVRMGGELPQDLDVLRAAARDEGLRSLEKLAAEWADGSVRFDRPGEALFAAYLGDDLTGVGGVTQEPADEAALRMRRLYVHPGRRRALASEMIRHASEHASRLTSNAAASPAARPFWESLGFRPEPGAGWTHVLLVR